MVNIEIRQAKRNKKHELTIVRKIMTLDQKRITIFGEQAGIFCVEINDHLPTLSVRNGYKVKKVKVKCTGNYYLDVRKIEV